MISHWIPQNPDNRHKKPQTTAGRWTFWSQVITFSSHIPSRQVWMAFYKLWLSSVNSEARSPCTRIPAWGLRKFLTVRKVKRYRKIIKQCHGRQWNLFLQRQLSFFERASRIGTLIPWICHSKMADLIGICSIFIVWFIVIHILIPLRSEPE